MGNFYDIATLRREQLHVALKRIADLEAELEDAEEENKALRDELDDAEKVIDELNALLDAADA